MSDGVRDLLIRGLAAARSKEFFEARRYLEWALRLDPDEEQRIEAWLALAEISSDPKEKRNFLEEVLARDQGDARARRMLAILDGKLKAEDVVDPDHLAQPVVEVEQATGARRFICPQCGGRMTFRPDGKSLICEYCESRRTLSIPRQDNEQASAGQSFTIAMATARGHLRPAARRTFTCQGCGMNFVLPPQQLTLTCPHCASAYVVDSGEVETILPNGVIPFGVGETQAKRLLRAWLERTPALKGVLVTGGAAVYVPAWAFDLSGSIGWRGMRQAERKLSTAELLFGGGRRREWETARGDHPVLRGNVLVLAAGKWPEACLRVLQTFDLSQVAPYDDGYLANWPAETYQLAVGDASLQARQSVLLEEQAIIRAQLGGQVRDLTFNSAGMIVDAFRLLLLPVWLVKMALGERKLTAVVNGQKGDVFGEA